MSLARVVYYSAVVGGWSGFVGWLVSELLLFGSGVNRDKLFGLCFTGAAVGAAIGAGVNVVAGLSAGNLRLLISRMLWGLAVGLAGGALGILLGSLLFKMGLPRPFGYAVIGLGVGLADGLYDRSFSKIRNGVIGGLLGGFVGGLFFVLLSEALNSSSGLAGRATAFVVMGMAVGGFVGLVQVALKEAWLTVLDGYRPGRQLILCKPVTALGRAEHLQLSFIGPLNLNLEPEHLRIVRQPNGQYSVEDNHSKIGASVNQQILSSPRVLSDGDVIKLGTNYVRFNERRKSQGSPFRSGDGTEQQSAVVAKKASPLPPPPPKSKAPPPPLPEAKKAPLPVKPAAPAPVMRPPPPPPPSKKSPPK